MNILDTLLSVVFQAIIENLGRVVAFSVATVIGVISLWYANFARKNYALSRRSAEKQAELRVGLFDVGSPKDVYIVLPFVDPGIFLIPLPIAIKNIGNLTARNVQIQVLLPEESYGRENVRVPTRITKARGMVHAADAGGNKHITQVYMNVRDIDPEVQMVFEDQLIATGPTVYTFPVEAPTKDGVIMKANVRIALAMVVDVMVTYENATPVRKRFFLHFRKGSSDDLGGFLTEERDILRGGGVSNTAEGEGGHVTPIYVAYYDKFDEIKIHVNETGKMSRRIVSQANLQSAKVLQGLLTANDIVVPEIDGVRP
jgi:hypothetical protein